MRIAEPMAMELQFESATTRKLLDRVPEDKFDWRPHPKSMTMRQLASHLAENPLWLKPTLETDEFVMNPAEYQPFMAKDKVELLATFDRNVADAVESLRGASDFAMLEQWRMKVGGKLVLEMPRAAAIRAMIISHLIHHRAQLGVYLRLNDVALPQVYGPTADAPDM